MGVDGEPLGTCRLGPYPARPAPAVSSGDTLRSDWPTLHSNRKPIGFGQLLRAIRRPISPVGSSPRLRPSNISPDRCGYRPPLPSRCPAETEMGVRNIFPITRGNTLSSGRRSAASRHKKTYPPSPSPKLGSVSICRVVKMQRSKRRRRLTSSCRWSFWI